jgi:hypothetical protein
MPDSLDDHFNILLRDIQRGLLVPVIGGDVNLCGRPLQDDILMKWKAGGGPPTTSELALHLLEEAGARGRLEDDLEKLANILIEQLSYPQDSMSSVGLAKVCQYIQIAHPHMLEGLVPKILAEEYLPTPVHDFLVKLAQYQVNPAIPDARPYPCIVTTCFDQVLEQHLRKSQVPFHLVAYVLSETGGAFEYTPPGEDPRVSSREINAKNVERLQPHFEEHTVVIKLNGGIPAGGKNFAITEDNYIDYLSHQGIEGKMPPMLLAKLAKRGKIENSHLLFLGYSPRHWNLRVILHRIWSESLQSHNKRWSVIMEKRFSNVNAKFWQAYGLRPNDDLIQIDSLDTYVKKLMDRMAPLPKGNAATSPGSSSVQLTPAVRDSIFISYAHKDSRWHAELKEMLGPKLGAIKLWDDTMIPRGALWKEEIEKALASTKAAILLVSPAFLSSDFIAKNELPPLLNAAEKEGCKILWINVEESLVDYTAIAQYHALYHKPPLSKLRRAGRAEALKKIAMGILDEN